MDAALTVVFYTSAIGGLVAWTAAIRASGLTARWLYLGAAALLVVAGVLGMFSIGIIFLVLAGLCLVAAAREMRSPEADHSRSGVAPPQ
jgi:hypothetical protein